MTLVLASSSSIRKQMLEAAGVAFECDVPAIDEDAIKGAPGDSEKIALRLAQAKALAVSSKRAADWVIGSDSLVSVEERLFSKPASREEAAAHLRLFSGKVMQLTSAVALAQGSAIEWHHAETARLHVRELSDSFISDYLDREWPEVGYCVGVFRLEGRGVQLFSDMEGDYFSILGMPLIPLLGALRDRGLLLA